MKTKKYKITFNIILKTPTLVVKSIFHIAMINETKIVGNNFEEETHKIQNKRVK